VWQKLILQRFGTLPAYKLSINEAINKLSQAVFFLRFGHFCAQYNPDVRDGRGGVAAKRTMLDGGEGPKSQFLLGRL